MELVNPAPPPGVELIKGEWPRVRMGARDGASAGPTGVPWVDSNGWLIRLAAARRPDTRIWVEADPPEKSTVIPAEAHVLAVADAAAYGAQWVSRAVTPESLAAMRFFDAHAEWRGWRPRASLGILSDFAGANEFLSQELLNLTARLHEPYRILIKSKSDAAALRGLKAVVYPDGDPPAGPLRQALLDFVKAGGLVVAGPKFGEGPAGRDEHPRFRIANLGKGRLAISKEDFSDPYLLAADAQVLLSHRNDLVRFWNPGAIGSYLTGSPDGKRALLHLLNYTGRSRRDAVTVQIAGPWRAAKLWTFAGAQEVKSAPGNAGIEVHLPPVAVYAAVEVS